MKNKSYFRTCVRDIFSRTSREILDNAAKKIIDLVITVEQFIQANTVLLFHPLSDEINILRVAEFCFSEGKTVCFPVSDIKTRSIIIKEIKNIETEMIIGVYGIHEPLSDCPCVESSELDCIITPGRAFDHTGNRIGRGAGYYDNLLKNIQAATIAPVFSFQVFDNVPAGPHDIPVDIIVTEHGITFCSER